MMRRRSKASGAKEEAKQGYTPENLEKARLELVQSKNKENKLKRRRETGEARSRMEYEAKLNELLRGSRRRGNGRPSLGARKLSRNKKEPRLNVFNPLVQPLNKGETVNEGVAVNEGDAVPESEVVSTNRTMLAKQVLPAGRLSLLSQALAKRPVQNQLVLRNTRRNKQSSVSQNLGQLQETIQGVPAAVGEIHNNVAISREQLDEVLSILRVMAPSVQNIETHAESHLSAIDDVKANVIERSKKLETLYKKMRHGRSGLNVETNLIIYYICLYYKMLWTLTRFCLEYIYLMTRLGMQFCNMAPLWTLGIGQCLLIYLLWILYSFVIQGAVFFVIPIPDYSIYPLIFNEGYLLDMMAVQLGGLVMTLFNGINRIRSLPNPGNRALGLFAESAGLYRAKDYVWGILEVPYNYVSEEIVGRISVRLSALMPDGLSSVGSSVMSGVSSIGSGIASGAGAAVSSVGSSVVSGVSSIGSGLASGAGAAVSSVGSSVVSGVSSIGSGLASGAGAAVSSVGSSVVSGASSVGSSVASKASSMLSGAGSAKNYVKGYWTGSGGSNSPKLIANQEYDLTEKTFNLVDFEEFDKVSLLTPEQQKEFNKSPMGKNLNKLKIIMDKVFIKNMEHLLKFETLRVSEFMVYIGNILDNIVDNGMPYFRQSFSNHVEVYKELKKHKLKVINTKQFFPELLNIDIETLLHPRRNIRMKTLKRK